MVSEIRPPDGLPLPPRFAGELGNCPLNICRAKTDRAVPDDNRSKYLSRSEATHGPHRNAERLGNLFICEKGRERARVFHDLVTVERN